MKIHYHISIVNSSPLRTVAFLLLMLGLVLSSVHLDAKGAKPTKGKAGRTAVTKKGAKGVKGKSLSQKAAKQKGKKGKTYAASSKRGGKGKHRRVASAERSRTPKAIAHIVITDDSLITEGIIYRKLEVVHTDSSKSIVHALTCVLRNPQYNITTVKCENRADGLERLCDLVYRVDSTENKKIVAAVNGNFWRAVSNTAIGPTVVNGEVVEMLPYKNWNSCFFDLRGRPVIDTFRLRATIRTSLGKQVSVSSVNRRVMKDSIVWFNSFVGNSVPYVPQKVVERALEEASADSAAIAYDSTIVFVNKDSLQQAVVQANQEAHAEFPYAKITLRYLRSPIVNQDMPMMVLGIADSGTVNMPLRGCVLSLKKDVLKSLNIAVGDTLFARFSSNVYDSLPFINAVCGTPRLVVNGTINDHLLVVDNPNARFVNNRLARTAVGTDITRSTLYVVTVESNARSRGFSIAEMAEFMKTFGAYNAVNLDGGGSSQMVLGSNVVSHLPESRPRRVAVALALMKKKNTPKPQSQQKGDDN